MSCIMTEHDQGKGDHLRESRWCLKRLVVCYFGLSFIVPLASMGADRKETIRQARASYYNLKDEGLTEFRCEVQLDWDSMYKSLKTDAVGRDQLLPILRKVHFQVVVGPDGASTVSHQSELAPQTEEVADRVRRSIAGAEQILTGFLQSWSPLVFTSPFPNIDSEYQLADLGDKFVLNYKEGTASVITSMSHDFAIEELKVTTPELEGTVRPKLSRNKKGFVLVGYDGSYKAASGTPLQLAVKIEYRNVEGLDLPGTVDATISLPNIVNVHLTFLDYQVKRVAAKAQSPTDSECQSDFKAWQFATSDWAKSADTLTIGELLSRSTDLTICQTSTREKMSEVDLYQAIAYGVLAAEYNRVIYTRFHDYIVAQGERDKFLSVDDEQVKKAKEVK